MKWIIEAESIDDIVLGRYAVRLDPLTECRDCRKHNVNAGYKEDCCPMYEYRGISYGHEHDFQYCSFAERREE